MGALPLLGQAQRTRIWAQVSELRDARPFQNPCPVAIQNGAPAPHASSPLPSPREAGLDPLGEEWRRLCHKLGSPRYGRPSTPAPVRFPSAPRRSPDPQDHPRMAKADWGVEGWATSGVDGPQDFTARAPDPAAHPGAVARMSSWGRDDGSPTPGPLGPGEAGWSRQERPGAERQPVTGSEPQTPRSPVAAKRGPRAPRPVAEHWAPTRRGPDPWSKPHPAVEGRGGPGSPHGPDLPVGTPARSGRPQVAPNSAEAARPWRGLAGRAACGLGPPLPAGAHPEDEIEDEEQVFDALGAALHPHGGAGAGAGCGDDGRGRPGRGAPGRSLPLRARSLAGRAPPCASYRMPRRPAPPRRPRPAPQPEGRPTAALTPRERSPCAPFPGRAPRHRA